MAGGWQTLCCFVPSLHRTGPVHTLAYSARSHVVLEVTQKNCKEKETSEKYQGDPTCSKSFPVSLQG